MARSVDPRFWAGRRVLVTGHTGFKGAWLSLWLQALGARVTGFARTAPTRPSLYELARVGEGVETVHGEIADGAAVAVALAKARPEVVFHLAAQPLVRRSYAEPYETYAANVMGTVSVLEAVRRAGGVRAVVCVTSDKCYENATRERAPVDGFCEDARLGGADPYSSSKAAAELVVGAYRRSFFAREGSPRVASARAGNVIGGGDWGEDRLLPDLLRAAASGGTACVRNPAAVRPWQHVLAPLSGYVLLAQALWADAKAASAWNFGPPPGDAWPVGRIAGRVAELWPGGVRWEADPGPHPPEASALRLDSTRARELLGWRAQLDLEQGLAATVAWHLALQDGADMRAVTVGQIEALGGVAGAARQAR